MDFDRAEIFAVTAGRKRQGGAGVDRFFDGQLPKLRLHRILLRRIGNSGGSVLEPEIEFISDEPTRLITLQPALRVCRQRPADPNDDQDVLAVVHGVFGELSGGGRLVMRRNADRH